MDAARGAVADPEKSAATAERRWTAVTAVWSGRRTDCQAAAERLEATASQPGVNPFDSSTVYVHAVVTTLMRLGFDGVSE